MTINWQDVITALGGQAALLLAIAWILKSVVSHRLSREAEEFKTRLKADADIEIERLKNSLKMIAVEHDVRFSKLHAKRAEVIADLYSLLWEARALAAQFILHDTRDANQSQKAREKVAELFRFISVNRIYLPKSVCGLLDRFESMLRKSVAFVEVYWVRIEFPNQATREQANKVMLDAVQVLESGLPALFDQLETEFRALLGGETVLP